MDGKARAWQPPTNTVALPDAWSRLEREHRVTPTEWLTIGLVVFAGAQVWMQDRGFRKRIAERKEEEDRRIDQARTHLTIEWYRMRNIAAQWIHVDIATSIHFHQFNPGEILPHDRRSLVSDIARLGETPTLLAMESLLNAENAAILAKQLVVMVEQMANSNREILPDETLKTYESGVNSLVASIHRLALEATNCLEDAVENSPVGSGQALDKLKPNPVSQMGRNLAASP